MTDEPDIEPPDITQAERPAAFYMDYAVDRGALDEKRVASIIKTHFPGRQNLESPPLFSMDEWQ